MTPDRERSRALLGLIGAVLLAAALMIAAPTAVIGQETQSVVTVNAVPPGKPVTFGEDLLAVEMTQTRQLSEGAVGPFAVFVNDGGYAQGTCTWNEALASGVDGWFGLTVRGAPCPAFQGGINGVTAAGGDGLIVANNLPGAPVAGTAAGTIPGLMISDVDGARLNASLNPASPEEVRVTLQVKEVAVKEDLPPPPPGYSPPPRGGGGFGNEGGGSEFGSGFGQGQGLFGDDEPEPQVSPTTILVPGPDGELVEMEVPVLVQAREEGPQGPNLLIPVIAAILLLGAGAGGFFFIRARRQAEEYY